MRRCFTCRNRFEDQRLICPSDSDVLVYEGREVPETGRILSGRYRLGNLLGEGGMGRVFEAEKTDGGGVVAIKLLKAELSGRGPANDAAEKRFEVEAQAASSLDHPGVVKVYEFQREPQGASYIAMERLYGSTLDELRRAGKFGQPERVVELMREVCDVLGIAHSKGIVHRDLKPSNIYLHRIDRDRSQVKVLDFGIAKILDRTGERLTSTGEFLGTLLYMAPELTAGHAVTTGADVYSLGVILFEALAGKVPFTGRNPMELIRVHSSMPAPALSSFRPEVSEELEEVVARCLHKKPEGRYSDAGELAKALASLPAVRGDGSQVGCTRTLRVHASNWVGLVLDQTYEIHEWVAPGRFGSDVYRATHLRTGADVALRLWRTGRGAVRDCLLEAFRKEAKTMGVRHANLVAVLDLGYNDECVYVVTELVGSISLRTLIGRKGGLARGVAVALIRGAADALKALHERGIVSGGLSPETIRVAEGSRGPERLLLAPFGLSNLKQLSSLFPRSAAAGERDRSSDYISPEQMGGAPPDPRSDLYSLGLILLEMMGGEIPEQELPPTKTSKDLNESVAPGSEISTPEPKLPANLPAEWMFFFERAVARNPAHRFASAVELVEALPA